MPRFYFHIHDGESAADIEGTVLSSAEAAKQQAIETSGELLKEQGPKLFGGTEWSMDVVDEAGAPVCTLRVLAETYLDGESLNGMAGEQEASPERLRAANGRR